jgi:hypothetical protein
MKQQPIDANLPLSVTMAASEWERVLQILGKAPYEQVAGAIQAIAAQCMTGAQGGNRSTEAQ